MQMLIGLLERKNLCFKSFHKLCHDFLDEIAKGDTANLELFQKRRQGLLTVVEQLEFEVTSFLNAMIPGAEIPRDVRTKVDLLLREKDSIVKSILDLDLQILAYIDRMKDETIQKLQSLQSGRRTVGAYRSPIDNVEAAEGIKILDHEA